MALSPLDRPQQPSSANRMFGRASRGVSGGLGLQLTTVHNRGAASKPLRDATDEARGAKSVVPRAVAGDVHKVPAVEQDDVDRDSCQYFVKLLLSHKQGIPVEQCLESNRRRQC